MPHMPLVSVIIPAYNAEKTIRKAIDSVLRQTIADLEVIVVDDASDDTTTQQAKAVADPRVRLVKSLSNSGPSAARNVGVRQAAGRWVAFLDADDQWVPDRLQYLTAAADGEIDCFITDCNALCIPDPEGHLKPLGPPNLPPGPLIVEFDFARYVDWGRDVKPIVTRASLIRHNIEFPEWGSGGDWSFFIARLSASGIRGKLLRRAGYLYRVTGTHDSSTLRAIEEQLRVQELLAADCSVPEPARERLKKSAPWIRKRLVVAALRERKWNKFVRYACRNPRDLMILPGSVFRFIARKIRYRAATLSVPSQVRVSATHDRKPS